jgi:DNA-binding CsgD family transcriptional regulator
MTRAVKIAPARLAALLADPALTWAQIEAELGAERRTLLYIAEQLGIAVPPRDTRKRHDKAAVARLWADGLSSSAIGAALDMHPAYVRTLARRLDLQKRRGA